MASGVVLLVSLLVFFVQGHPALVEDIKYIGCYTDDFAKSRHYKIDMSLSFLEGVNFCNHRLTQYVGIQTDPSSMSFVVPFCGDDIPQGSNATPSTFCHLCEDPPDKTCGGENVISVYHLPEVAEFLILLATETGVMMISEKSNITTSIEKSTGIVRTIDFLYEHDSIFFGTYDKILRSVYNPISMMYSTTSIVKPRDSGRDTPSYVLTVDWEEDTIYYIDNNYNGYNWNVYRSDVDGTNNVPITGVTEKFKSMIIEPYYRLLIYIDDNQLHSYKLGTDSRMAFDNNSFHMSKVLRIAVDTTQETLYVVGTDDTSTHYLLSSRYDGSKVRVLYKGPELYTTLGLAVVNSRVVWAAYDDTDRSYRVYVCQLSPKCEHENLTMIYESSEAIHDLKVYSPDVQKPSRDVICSKLFCSHNCSFASPHDVRCTCPDGLLLGADNKTCQGQPKPQTDPLHVGCYTTLFAESRLYKAQHSLSWEESINLCNTRATTYAGVQAEQGFPTYNFVFCGNDIQHSTAANSSACLPCVDNPARFCGGNLTLSLYKLRESSPLVLLLATEFGLKIFSSLTSSAEALKGFSSNVTQVDFFFWEDNIFFISDMTLWRSYYSPFSDMYVEPVELYELGFCVAGLTVDWVNDFIYCRRDNNYVFEFDWTNPKQPRLVLSNLHEVYDMAVDPYTRQLFYIKDGQVHLTLIDKLVEVDLDNRRFHLKKVLKFALDVDLKLIYMIGTENNASYYLIRTDYQLQKMKVLYSGVFLTNPIGLDVLQQEVVWGTNISNRFTIHRCTLVPRCLPETVEVVHRASEAIFDFKIYHPEKQAHNSMYLCWRLNCSHNCSEVSGGQMRCLCPGGMNLLANNRTCQDVPVTTFPTSNGHMESTHRTPSGVWTYIAKTRSTTTNSNAASFPHFFNTTPSTTLAGEQNTKIYDKSTSLTNITINKENDTFFSQPMVVINVFGILLIIALLLGLTYLMARNKHKLIPTLGNSYKPTSELELTHSNVGTI